MGTNNENRAVRGGSWNEEMQDSRTAFIGEHTLAHCNVDIGVRLVLRRLK